MEIKDRQKSLLIITGCALALLLGNSVILDPLTKSWDSRKKEIAALRQKVDHGNQLIKYQASIESRWRKMQANTLPNDQTAARSALLNAVDRWRQDSGLNIDQYAPQWKTEQDPDTRNDLTTLEFQTDASGNMRSVLRFLFDVESDPLGLRVDDLVISSRDNYGQQLSLGLHVSGLVLGPTQQQ